MTAVATVRAELRTDSPGVSTPVPRLTWTTVSDVPGWTQTAATVELDGRETAEVPGPDSVLVAWPFSPLEPRSEHTVRVRVTGSDGATSDWSEPHPIRADFLGDGEWTAALIGLEAPGDVAAPARLRAEFTIDKPVVRATLYATAHGVYQATINGTPVDDQVLKPGWTPYPERIIHETTDVTALVVEGANVIGLDLAGGWYTERFGFQATSQPHYGEQPAAAAQLRLDFEDGSHSWVATGPDWSGTGGPITSSGIYDGEHYDARRELDGWARPGFDASGWAPVRVDVSRAVAPTARTSPAVRAIEEVAVTEVITTPSGATILDFGQNLVGRLRIRVRGEAGTVVTLRHAEVLEHGELGVRPLRLAKATDSYVLRGGGEETWEPAFTFHGFRYAEITGLTQDVDPADFTAVVIHSDMRRTGWFESSHPLLNQLHENVVWGMRGNFLYLPTDCPQRDERLGWTGDIQVFAPAASFLYDTDAFLSSWLVDLALEQEKAGGVVPFIIPSVLGDSATPAAAWGDAATVVPSVLYERYGDLGMLADQFDSMKAWSDCLLGLAGDRLLWEGGFQFGDWLDPTAPPDNAALAKADPNLVASAYLFRSVDLTAGAAEILGRHDEARHYAELADAIRTAFLREYATDDGRLFSDAQTAYSQAIVFGLYRDTAHRDAMGARLAELVKENGFHIGTGFVGTPIITDALTITGHLDTAEGLLLETTNPSWLYPVTMGATTIWERWDSMLEDGTINPGEMTSFNHYAFGAVADWLHRTVAGLAPASAGYRKIRIAPRPLAQLDHASATLDTPYGPASVAWRREGSRITISATVPPNSSAEVSLPDGRPAFEVGSGAHSWSTEVPAL